MKEILWSPGTVQLSLVRHSSSSWVPAHPGSGWNPGDLVFCCWRRWVVSISHLTAGPQSSTSCSWTDPAWKDAAGICPTANLSQTHLDIAAALQWPTRRHPVVAASGQPSTALNLKPWSLMPVESGQSACRMMLLEFGRLRHLVCSPSLLKELHKASTSNGKENKPPSWVAEGLPPFLSLWVEREKQALSKVLECLSPVLNHQKPEWITHFSNCCNQAGNRLQPKTHKFFP